MLIDALWKMPPTTDSKIKNGYWEKASWLPKGGSVRDSRHLMKCHLKIKRLIWLGF
jgi:hypothetical protein